MDSTGGEEEIEEQVSGLPGGSSMTVPSKRKRQSPGSTHPATLVGEEESGVSPTAKPKKKRTKLGGKDTVEHPGLAEGVVSSTDTTEGIDAEMDSILEKDSAEKDEAGGNDIRADPVEPPTSLVETKDEGLKMGERDTEQVGNVPVPQAEQLPSTSGNLLSTTPLPPLSLPHPSTLSSPTDKQSQTTPPPRPTHATWQHPTPTFAELRKNIMRNLMFKGDPKVPFVNSNSPPVGSVPSRGGTPPRPLPAREGDHERAQNGSTRGKTTTEEERVKQRFGDGIRERSESPIDAVADDPEGSRAGSPSYSRAKPYSHHPQTQPMHDQTWDGEPRIIAPSAGYADWTPTQSEVDPFETLDRGVPGSSGENQQAQGQVQAQAQEQYQQTFRPDPPKKRGQGKKKRAMAAVEGLREGSPGTVGATGLDPSSMTPERGGTGTEHEGTPGETADGVVKKKRRTVKLTEEGAVSGVGTWRKGLKKGQTRADAIAMFREKNPGVPLPPGWDFPSIAPHPPANTRVISFKKEPVLKVAAVVPEPKGDIISYISVPHGPVARSSESGPSRPSAMATALKIDISKVDETDFEKLGVEIGPPLAYPNAHATRESLGHPVFKNSVEMQGLPYLKVVDPSKIQKERDTLCPRELKENLPGKPRRFQQKELSITSIGGSRLTFKTWTSANSGPSTWQLHRDARVAEQQRVVEEAVMNEGTVTGAEGTPVQGAEGYYDDNGQYTLASAGSNPSSKNKRGGLTKTGKQRRQWTKKGDKPDPNKRIADSLRRMEGSPLVGTPEIGSVAVNSELGSSPAPMPDIDDAAVSQVDYSRPPSPIPGLSATGDDLDAEMEDLL